ncbi:hypothetical protein HCB37_04040 [Listeria booriae]|uniref:hypothetical protein n=1 Tax=Listeria booriae TaxID=1552123 RepID=UPI0016253A91|nr:hypothetical protein [Listeria booriae]MBC2263683.1 hypothetical protein [Listeria booriae]
MASKNVSNIYVNPVKDNFTKSEGGVTIVTENKNAFGVESKIRIEKYNTTKKSWEVSCALQAAEGGLSPNGRDVSTLLNSYFFKQGVGKYRVYYEFYKITAKAFTTKLGALTTSEFNIK